MYLAPTCGLQILCHCVDLGKGKGKVHILITKFCALIIIYSKNINLLYMFRTSSDHLQEDTVVHMQQWYCHPLWEFLVACTYTAWVRTECRGRLLVGHLKTPYQQPSPYIQSSLKLCTYKPPGALIEGDSIICCMCTTVSSWRWALEARNI